MYRYILRCGYLHWSTTGIPMYIGRYLQSYSVDTVCTYLPVGSTVGEGLFAIDARSIPKRALLSLYRVAYTLNDCGRLQPSYATPRYCLE